MITWNSGLASLPKSSYTLYEFLHNGRHVSLHDLDLHFFHMLKGGVSLGFSSGLYIYRYDFRTDGTFFLFDVDVSQCALSGDVVDLTVSDKGGVNFSSTYIGLQFITFGISVSFEINM